jgi:hypothetical protein
MPSSAEEQSHLPSLKNLPAGPANAATSRAHSKPERQRGPALAVDAMSKILAPSMKKALETRIRTQAIKQQVRLEGQGKV